MAGDETPPHPADLLDEYLRSTGWPLAEDYEQRIAEVRARCDESVRMPTYFRSRVQFPAR